MCMYVGVCVCVCVCMYVCVSVAACVAVTGDIYQLLTKSSIPEAENKTETGLVRRFGKNTTYSRLRFWGQGTWTSRSELRSEIYVSVPLPMLM